MPARLRMTHKSRACESAKVQAHVSPLYPQSDISTPNQSHPHFHRSIPNHNAQPNPAQRPQSSTAQNRVSRPSRPTSLPPNDSIRSFTTVTESMPHDEGVHLEEGQSPLRLPPLYYTIGSWRRAGTCKLPLLQRPPTTTEYATTPIAHMQTENKYGTAIATRHTLQPVKGASCKPITIFAIDP